MATINSTIISGAGAISALKPVLAGKSILLVTDANVGKLEATKQIQHLMGENNVEVRIVDSVPAEPANMTWRKLLPNSRERNRRWSSVSAAAASSTWRSCSRYYFIPPPCAQRADRRRETAPASGIAADTRHRRHRLGSDTKRHRLFPNVIPKWGLSPRYCCLISWLCCRN